jgi:uroporphyrinogen decarboxylase
MRQAGRYLPEYRALRERYDFLTLCRTPELAAEVTLQPVRRFPLDAAILFTDILLPLEPMGLEVRFSENDGPVIANPLGSARDVRALRPLEPRESLAFVLDTIRIVAREIAGEVPLIGFAGAPFTMASYAVEGGSPRDYRRCKGLMWDAPAVWDELMNRLADAAIACLEAQVEAGVQAVQLFDSWAGALSPADYRRSVLPYSRRVIAAVQRTGVPVIHFALHTSAYLEVVREAGGDVVAVDWRIDLAEAWRRVGPGFAVQGNLDPMLLFASPAVIEAEVARILDGAGGRPGHIFNLGHGLHRETPPRHVEVLVDAVHRLSRAAAR